MRVIEARNVHQALAIGLSQLYRHGVQRESRNGPVLQMPTPVTTVYQRPMERVVFWPKRDANPFFHLYESLWMLAGRNDLAGLIKFNKQMANYSDDGRTINGSAYGYRWRRAFDPTDQLTEAVSLLQANHNERRVALQMWDASCDLGSTSKDIPCNMMATLQVNVEGALDLTVFCRSNDIVWGAYGANAVHFSILLEYMAGCVGVPVGRYYQVSVNWHGYLNTIEPLRELTNGRYEMGDAYADGDCRPVPMFEGIHSGAEFDRVNRYLLDQTDAEDFRLIPEGGLQQYPFFHIAYRMFLAHQVYRKSTHPTDRYQYAIDILNTAPEDVDWIRAGKEWMQRRLANWHLKNRIHDVMTAGFDGRGEA